MGHISLIPAAEAAASLGHTSIIEIHRACPPIRWQHVQDGRPVLLIRRLTDCLHSFISTSILVIVWRFSVPRLRSPLICLRIVFAVPSHRPWSLILHRIQSCWFSLSRSADVLTFFSCHDLCLIGFSFVRFSLCLFPCLSRFVFLSTSYPGDVETSLSSAYSAPASWSFNCRVSNCEKISRHSVCVLLIAQLLIRTAQYVMLCLYFLYKHPVIIVKRNT